MTNAITVHTDGSSRGNPGPSGYSAVIQLPGETDCIVITGGEPQSTNNRAELSGVLSALTYLFEHSYHTIPITIYTDSQYISRAVNEGWLSNWLETGFNRIKNMDLWLRMWKYLCALPVQLVWVRGHDGNPMNELADRLAVEASYYQGIPFKLSSINLANLTPTRKNINNTQYAKTENN
jgi:ribonuclease HI